MVLRVFKLVAFVAGLAAVAEAVKNENTLRQRISQKLEEALSSEAQGIENCENKCDKAFNKMAYVINAQNGTRTFEFKACVMGCTQCQADLSATNTSADHCFEYCKNFPWKDNGLLKGVIEPDKACLGGCVINTCQVICSGGTTDPTETPQNQQFFFDHGGCSIKTAAYSQFLEYVPFNSPNTGQGGSQAAASCCSNAFSLCQYVGPTTTTNYQQLLANTANICKNFVATGTVGDICAFFSNPQNCGNTL